MSHRRNHELSAQERELEVIRQNIRAARRYAFRGVTIADHRRYAERQERRLIELLTKIEQEATQ